MTTDAIVVLKEDHAAVKRLFRQFERADDVGQKGQLARQIIGELTAHTFVENEVMYPAVRSALPDLRDDVLESYEEHHVVDLLCQELWDMGPDDEHFDAKMTVLMENVQHHVQEEETDWFPKVRKGLDRATLQDIGQRILTLKADAPKDPTEPRAVQSAQKALSS